MNDEQTLPQCLLTDMFRQQALLQDKMTSLPFPVSFTDFNEGKIDQLDEHDQGVTLHLVEQNALAQLQESSELLDWTPWKHWSQKTGNKEVAPEDFCNRSHIKEMRREVIDAMCFLMNNAMALGMTPEIFYNEYCEKMGINHDRQDSGVY